MELIQAQERRCTGNEPLSRQLLQVAGTVLLDIEITVKLIVQGKVSCATFLWYTNMHHGAQRWLSGDQSILAQLVWRRS